MKIMFVRKMKLQYNKLLNSFLNNCYFLYVDAETLALSPSLKLFSNQQLLLSKDKLSIVR